MKEDFFGLSNIQKTLQFGDAGETVPQPADQKPMNGAENYPPGG
jgi:hypothetical protein